MFAKSNFHLLKANLVTLIFFVSVYEENTLAQNTDKNSGLQAGYVKSWNYVTYTKGSLLSMPEIFDKPGFFIGISHSDRVGKWIRYRAELNFYDRSITEKVGIIGQRIKVTKEYKFIGFAPTLGGETIKNLSVFLGPAFNFSLNKGEVDRIAQPIEYGLVATSTYDLRQINLVVSYFRGLTPFSKTGNSRPYFSFYNQNWQIGISYKLRISKYSRNKDYSERV